MASSLQIRELDDASRPAWDAFVISCHDATFFHRAGWKRVIERSFGHRTYYLYAEKDGRIEGVLPLVHIKAPALGSSLSSLAFCVYGGPAAESPEVRTALDQAARALADRLDVDHLEYRHIRSQAYPGAVEKADLYVTFRKPIEAEVEKNLLAIPRKQRAMVRKAQKLGLQAEIDQDCGRLFAVYSESVRNLGTPVFSRRYFEELKREFAEDCEILIVTNNGNPVSGVMSFYFRDEVLPYYGGGTERARELAANDFMYWEVMRRACERGCRSFDFGRSKRATGAFDFKKNWGFSAESLCYQYVMRRGTKPPDVNPLNPKFRLFVETWKHLPLSVANFIGPHIVKYLG
jgi:FemAB-related protein (PEP-CTERM system-associated)